MDFEESTVNFYSLPTAYVSQMPILWLNLFLGIPSIASQPTPLMLYSIPNPTTAPSLGNHLPQRTKRQTNSLSSPGSNTSSNPAPGGGAVHPTYAATIPCHSNQSPHHPDLESLEVNRHLSTALTHPNLHVSNPWTMGENHGYFANIHQLGSTIPDPTPDPNSPPACHYNCE